MNDRIINHNTCCPSKQKNYIYNRRKQKQNVQFKVLLSFLRSHLFQFHFQ